MSKLEYHIDDQDITLESEGLQGVVNTDDMTSIHYENIEGEILTVATELNKVGLVKALAERTSKKAKLELEIYSAGFNKDVRREASLNSNHFTMDGDRIKLTENSLKEALYLDGQWQKLSGRRIDDEANLEMVSSLYWAINEKAKKLDKLMYTFNKGEEEKTRARVRD